METHVPTVDAGPPGGERTGPIALLSKHMGNVAPSELVLRSVPGGRWESRNLASWNSRDVP